MIKCVRKKIDFLTVEEISIGKRQPSIWAETAKDEKSTSKDISASQLTVW